MNRLRFLFRRFFRRRDLESELEEELAFHVHRETALRVEEGQSELSARQQALRQFGNLGLVAEATRRQWGLAWIDEFSSDLRIALRQAARSPRLTFAIIATLAIGIAAQATVYSVVHAVLIDPYPYRDAMRMVHFHLYDKEPAPFDLGLTAPQFLQFETSPVLDGAVADDAYTMSLTGGDLPEQLQVARMSLNSFQYFGVPPLLGRTFGPSDRSRVAVLSYRFWKSHFAGRPDTMGKVLQLNREDYTIIGVMPPRFAWLGSDAYVPLPYSADPRRPVSVYGRIRKGVTDKAAEQALQPMLDAFAKETPPNFPVKFKVHVVPINEIAIGRFRGVLILLFISVSFLLLLACVNVAILLLARGQARQAEIAMRKALGASRLRIIAQLLTESVLFSSMGGCFGILLTFGGVHLIRHFIEPLPLFPPEANITVNLPVLIFSVAISMFTGISCWLWPALLVSRVGLSLAVSSSAHKVASRRGAQRSHIVLLAVQVTMTILLLSCSGATLRRLFELVHTNLGYDPQNLASVNLVIREGVHNQWADRVYYYEQIRKAIASDPGVLSAAIGSLPSRNVETTSISAPGLPDASGYVVTQGVSSGYFSTARIPLLRGRVWTRDEGIHATRLALINQTMRRRFWPDADPIGQIIVLNHGVANGDVWKLVAPGDDQHFQVIGVVGDVPNRGLDEAVYPGVYIPYSMTPYDGFDIAFRARSDPAGLLHAIEEHVHSVDATQAVGSLVSAHDLLEDDSLGRERFAASLFGGYAFLALAFAMCGLYSVQSYLVTQRTREFGVRIALGAKRVHIAYLVTKGCALAVFCGTVVGLFLAVALNRIFVEWTSGDTRDPFMLSAVILLLLLAAGAASVLPARTAAHIPPMDALRSE